MNELALLVAATIASGTPLALAGLGLLLNERAGVLNLGAEGMMLVAAVAGLSRRISALLGDRGRFKREHDSNPLCQFMDCRGARDHLRNRLRGGPVRTRRTVERSVGAGELPVLTST